MASGVYGSFLDFFGELFQEVGFYDQKPEVGAGYNSKTPTTYFMVIIQSDQGADIIANTGRLSLRNTWRAMDIENRDLMWTETGTPVKAGMFLIHPVDGRVYRVNMALEYNREGGFDIWGIEKVTGDDGTQTDRLEIISGAT